MFSGESGAGKTESTKFILKYISDVSRGTGEVENALNVEDAILQSRYLGCPYTCSNVYYVFRREN